MKIQNKGSFLSYFKIMVICTSIPGSSECDAYKGQRGSLAWGIETSALVTGPVWWLMSIILML